MTTGLAPETWDRGVKLEFAGEDDRGRVRLAECGAVRLPVLLQARQTLFDLRPATPGIDGPVTSMVMKSAGRWKRNATSRNLI